MKSCSLRQFRFWRGYEHSIATTKFSRLIQLLFYRVQKTFLKRNRTHNAGVAHRRAERPTNGLRFNSNGIIGNRITNSQEIMEKLHNKEYISSILLMEIQERKKMLRQVFAFGVRYQYFTDLKD